MTDTESHFTIEALQAGDPEAFARFVDATSGQVYRVALKILDNAQDAEDVLQETYIKAYRSISEFEGRSSLTTWLHRIAVNEALMLLRRHKGITVSLDEPVDESNTDQAEMEIADFCCLPEGDLLSSEARQFLEGAIQRLPTTLKIVFIMRDIERFSIQETAEALGVGEGVVKTRLLRARLKLRQDLSAYYGSRYREEMKR